MKSTIQPVTSGNNKSTGTATVSGANTLEVEPVNTPFGILRTSLWILRTGNWNDSGYWDDSATWKDNE